MIQKLFEGYIVPNGKWLTNEDGLRVRCSNCGATPVAEVREHKYNASIGINWCFNDKVETIFKYCPNCGANMRGEK